ncbi:MAG TPA: Ig-like domain repeat protein [Candidatus Micrarchaeaceae archaeon]|nr:Ig-like domain repeat protein [Candidatus Micrarchaeaceae archaeon]
MFFFPAKVLRFFPLLLAASFLSLLSARSSFAQTSPALIQQPVNNSALVTLARNTHPLARPEFDRGPAPPSLPFNRMLLVLKRSPAQQAALDSLVARQQQKSSPSFHQWLSPAQFGAQFGPADSDVAIIQSWLVSQGFHDIHVSNGRVFVEFSGTAAQVQSAFHTSIHHYVVNGVDHWANATNPQIPAALAPAIDGVATLHNFFKQPQLLNPGERLPIQKNAAGKPAINLAGSQHGVGPGDFAVIYNVNPLYQQNINGTGRTIAVVGRSNIDIQDVYDFRDLFQLSGPLPGVIVNGDDPGILEGGEQIEATLDTTWASAVANGAQVNLIVSASTNTTDGVDLSEAYIIDNDLGDIMTESFGSCEANATQADADQISALAEQAAAEGISYFVSTGDNGAEGCDNPNIESKATGPISVNVLASTPFTIAVGGTVFDEGANTANYWSTSNTSLTTALSYIPENVWNDSCATKCGPGGPNIWAGSGGASQYFAKPSWQASVSGIPSDSARDLPDVSLTAAPHDGYVLCVEASCRQGEVLVVGGTSASTPSFAGIMALVDQNENSREGQANYVLYRLAAAETYSNCNGSSQSGLPNSSCIFNDVTVGNNAVPGESGYGSPTASYQSGVAYDLATGLGSVNVTNLVNGWSTARSQVPSLTLNLNPTGPITHGTSVTMSVTAGATPPESGTPSGDVSMAGPSSTSPSSMQQFSTAALDGNGNASAATSQLPGGTITLDAHYAGDGTFVPGDATASITVNPEASSTTLALSSGSPSGPPVASANYGTPIFFSSHVSGSSGVGTATGQVTFQEVSSGPIDGQAALNSSGVASTTTADSTLCPGSHTVVASYPGDASFQPSSSGPVTLTVSQATTTTSFTPSSGTIIADGVHALQIFVAGTGQGNSPTGTIQLFSGQSQVGDSLSLNADGTALGMVSLIGSSLPFGTNTLTATYSGDTNYVASTSSSATFNVVRPTTVSLSSSSNGSIVQGTSVTFTAAVSSPDSGPSISGTIQFSANGSPIGSTALNGGQAQISTTSLPPGTVEITATYSGDSNYGTNSATVSQVVTYPPSVAIAAQPTTIVVTNPGSSGETTLTFTSQYGFTGTFSLSPSNCSGLPSEATCTFSSSSVTLNSTEQTANVTLTVSTTAPSLVAPDGFRKPGSGPEGRGVGEIAAILLLLLATLLLTRRQRWSFVRTSLAILALAAIASCGGGGGSGPQNPGTPVGSSNVKVTVNTGSGSQSVSVQLTVN